MPRFRGLGLPVVLVLSWMPVCACADASDDPSESLETVLAFEGPHDGDTPYGWGGGPSETIHLDSLVVHGGKWAARLHRDSTSARTFTTVTKGIPADFQGETLTLAGFLRTENVAGFAGLWMREDGDSGTLQFDNMQSRGLKGTTEWTEYTITLPLDPGARSVYFGALVSGVGTLWVDDVRILVDQVPVSQAPKVEQAPTVLDTDTEFDDGSGISITRLSPVQTANLVTLCKVWGFLKYHHPRITGGGLHWDYELFRVLPAALAAGDREAGDRALVEWVGKVGPPEACDPCAAPSKDPAPAPDLDWIHDRSVLGDDLAAYLETVYANRHADGPQFYVSRKPGVGNADFLHEPPYTADKINDAGYRILAFFRFWNMVQYWFPYRDVIAVNPGETAWADVPGEVLPRLVAAADADAYAREMIALTARVHDTHCNLWSSTELRPPSGTCALPVVIRFIEDKAVVTGYADAVLGPACGLRIGDIIETVAGRPVADSIRQWAPYYAASNPPTRLRDIARSLTRGACGTCTVTGERNDGPFTLHPERVPRDSLDVMAGFTHDRSGPAFQLLSPDIAYLKLSSVEKGKAGDYAKAAAGTRGFIIDIRNYPAQFMVFDLGGYLVREPTAFVRFTAGDLANPGAFTLTDPIRVAPKTPRYPGKIVLLVDEATQSSAEYTAMAFRAAGAVVVGSTTAGADGNVSTIPLPGGLRSLMSGIGVFYPDGTPTQRVGIVPDVVVRPTIEGVREGRDEVLEAGLRQILGEDADEALIRKLAAR